MKIIKYEELSLKCRKEIDKQIYKAFKKNNKKCNIKNIKQLRSLYIALGFINVAGYLIMNQNKIILEEWEKDNPSDKFVKKNIKEYKCFLNWLNDKGYLKVIK